MSSLEGKTALITGSARGIGREIALEFARRGADIVVTAIEADRAGIEQTAKEIRDLGRKTLEICDR